jgi:endogenous inhibitor of DNA gyrase (YacG/DUF329 family)
MSVEMSRKAATIKAMQRCPTCRSEVRPRVQNQAFPFCTARCRAVDLGRWFTGGYCVPGDPLLDRTPDREAAAAGRADGEGRPFGKIPEEHDQDSKPN